MMMGPTQMLDWSYLDALFCCNILPRSSHFFYAIYLLVVPTGLCLQFYLVITSVLPLRLSDWQYTYLPQLATNFTHWHGCREKGQVQKCAEEAKAWKEEAKEGMIGWTSSATTSVACIGTSTKAFSLAWTRLCLVDIGLCNFYTCCRISVDKSQVSR